MLCSILSPRLARLAQDLFTNVLPFRTRRPVASSEQRKVIMPQHYLVWSIILLLELSACALPAVTRTAALSRVRETVRVGDTEGDAIRKFQVVGFRCWQMAPHEWGPHDAQTLKAVSCYTRADQSEAGYTVVSAFMAIDHQHRVRSVTPVWYPVLYRNLSTGGRGRVIQKLGDTQ